MSFCIILFSSILFLTPDTNAWKNFAYGQNNDIVEGHLNIFHGHLEDGTPLYEFHLLDFDTFSRPAIILELSNNISIKELVELTGKKVKVKGTIFDTSTNPPFQRMQVVTIKPIGATVELDQKVYTWTDKVHITIVAPHFNLDSNLKEEIGGPSSPVKISTREGDIDNYILREVGNDDGIFTGEVILTGFAHDADGNSSTGDGHGNDVKPSTGGTGPTDGFIETGNDGGITVSFESSMDKTVVGSALIRWNIGEVQWLSTSYPTSGPADVRITDRDMNLDPEDVDSFEVGVWSNSDGHGIDLTVTETKEDSGIFEGTVILSDVSESSSNKLKVSGFDTVTVDYEDNTLPDPYTIADELDITGTAIVLPAIIITENPEQSNINGKIIRTVYEENDNFYETYRLLYDLFHDESKLVYTSHEPDVPIGSGVPSEFKSHILPVRFSDLPNTTPHPTDYFLNRFYNSDDSLASYLRSNSYGNFNLQGSASEWKTLPENKEFYVDSQSGELRPWVLRDDALKLFWGEINFDGNDNEIQNVEDHLEQPGPTGDDIDQLVIITNDRETPDQSSSRTVLASSYLHAVRTQTSDGELWVYVAFFLDKGDGFPLGIDYQKGYGAAAHELGHNFNLYHTPMFKPHDTHADPWSVLSGKNDENSSPGFISQQKRKLHWIGPEDVIQISPGQSDLVKLDYLNNPSPSNRYLMAEIPLDSRDNFYTVEARTDSMFDNIPKPTGLMIYSFNSEGHGDDITSNLELDRMAPLSVVSANEIECRSMENGICTDADYGHLALNLGQTFTDPNNGIQIQLVSESKDYMSVCISNKNNSQVPKVLVQHENILEDQSMVLKIEFKYCFSESLIEQVEYALSANQNGVSLLQVNGETDTGFAEHRTNPLINDASIDNPVEVEVTFQTRSGSGSNQIRITENIQVVPEFEAVTVVALSISIIVMISLTSRTKLSMVRIYK